MQDRNFDDIAEKFSRNIYGTTKGQLRQAILWQDLDRVLAEMGPQKLRVLDAGGGEGQTAIKMAERGASGHFMRSFCADDRPRKTGGRSKRCERQHAIYTLRRSGCCFAFGNAR